MAVVLFKKGNPSGRDGDVYFYSNQGIFLKKEKVSGVLYECQLPDYQSLNGIKCGEKAATIKERFKGLIVEKCHLKKATERMYQIPTLNTAYGLQSGKVDILLIRKFDDDVSGKQNQSDWIDCKNARYSD
jgi:hypothetical protein